VEVRKAEKGRNIILISVTGVVTMLGLLLAVLVAHRRAFLLFCCCFCVLFLLGLTSTIPTEIGRLTNLIFVDLDYNKLTGSIPTELYALTDLETLDLNDNLLTGNIDSMGVFGNLEFLQLQSKWFF